MFVQHKNSLLELLAGFREETGGAPAPCFRLLSRRDRKQPNHSDTTIVGKEWAGTPSETVSAIENRNRFP